MASSAAPVGVSVVFLQRGIEIGAVGRRGQRGPEQRAPGTEVDGRGNNRNVEDRIVAAVDAELAGVVDQQGCQQDLDQHHGGAARIAARWR